jgi:ParB/RepB/Spo0J family partition protein
MLMAKLRWGPKLKKHSEASEIFEVNVSEIRSQPNREVCKEAVIGIKDSIARIGLQNPISLRRIDDDSYDYEVIAGHHRFLACRQLGMKTIPSRILSGVNAKLQRHSENLHRVELTLLQRFEDIAGYQKAIIKGAKNTPGGVQPCNKGISETARELKTSRKKVQHAIKASKLEPDVKRAIAAAGFANSESFINRMAQLDSREERERELLRAKSRSRATYRSSGPSPTTGVTFAAMLASWRKSQTSRLWRTAPLTERRSFVDHIQADNIEEDTD